MSDELRELLADENLLDLNYQVADHVRKLRPLVEALIEERDSYKAALVDIGVRAGVYSRGEFNAIFEIANQALTGTERVAALQEEKES